MKPIINQKINDIARKDLKSGILQKFDKDSGRAERFGFEFESSFFDFSKTHISDELIAVYQAFADDIGLIDKRHQLFSGVKINTTEDRAVLHTLLRDSSNQGIETVSQSALEDAKASELQFYERYQSIVSKLNKRDEPITDIIHVGIGGSSLGTQLLFESLVDVGAKIKVHFIDNIDAHKLTAVLDVCNAKNTLLIGVSKTFTTAETLQNIESVSTWYENKGVHDWRNVFYAVTSKPENAYSYGVNKDNVVAFPEWVGGRYSVWSAVSLSAVIVLGIERFKDFLSGASAMDKHFYTTDLSSNICFIAAVLDHYYANFLGVRSRAIFPYDYRMRSLIPYLQQLETESNGKDRQKDGRDVDQHTSMVLWGGVGTGVQHSVFQMMHQGTSLIPAEFILIKKPKHKLDSHHRELMANGLAQTAALLKGQTFEAVKELNKNKKMSDLTLKSKIFSGNRPSSSLLLEELTPYSLGFLLAYYEHRTFCGGVFLNINSYDQMGVELGKRLAKSIRPLLDRKNNVEAVSSVDDIRASFDSSTLNLLDKLLSG